MYCSNCGTTLNTNLNYCNSCGTRVENRAMVVKTGAPVLGVGGALVGVIGLMAFYPIMRELLRSPLETPAMIVILIAYLLTVFSMFGILVWQGRKHATETVLGGNQPSDGFGGHAAFRSINTAQLPEPISQPASVTDHTTRTLDYVPRKNSAD